MGANPLRIPQSDSNSHGIHRMKQAGAAPQHQSAVTSKGRSFEPRRSAWHSHVKRASYCGCES